MIFRETRLEGVFLLELEPIRDERGCFARAWCQREFASRGIDVQMVQANIALSRRKHTLRGLHYQLPPSEEAKLIRCTRGRIFDITVDLRRDSPTFGEWLGVEISSADGRMVYVPPGCAHGYMSMEDNTEVFYQVSRFYAPERERGIRWDDPAFGIRLPGTDRPIVSEKDRSWPPYSPAKQG